MVQPVPSCLVLIADPVTAPLDGALVGALGGRLGGAVRWLGDDAAVEIMLDCAPPREVVRQEIGARRSTGR